MQSLPIIFSAVFALIGFVISLSVGLIVQNEILYVFWIAFVCLILSALLGFGVYKILELKVPEFLSILRGEAAYEGDESGLGDLSEDNMQASSFEEDSGEGLAETDSSKVFGDHILVNKVKIKNEPKLIAQAIQTMLARDN
ncbi:MAG: hypothetical protein OEZ34_04960 [Spirochaetia bacterium]|nr:hypothetical protein [Spirochaetia bacterium]